MTKLLLTGLAIATLFSCSMGNKSHTVEQIESTQWNLTTLKGNADSLFADPTNFTLLFSSTDKRVAGTGACNNFMGNYAFAGKDSLTLNIVGHTMMMCPNQENEDIYFKLLKEVNRYSASNGKLTLFNNKDVVAEFEGEVEEIQ